MRPLWVVTGDVQVKAGPKAEFDPRRDECSLVMTPEALEAARAVEGDKADWMMRRLCLPMIDGVQFMSYLLKRRFGRPGGWLPGANTAGAMPRSMHFETLAAHVRDCLSHLERGQHHGVTLLDFFWFCIEEQQTLRLEVSAGGRTAVLHVVRGKLVHASCEKEQGESVFLKVMSWKKPCLSVSSAGPTPYLSIYTSMRLLLTLADAVQEACFKASLSGAAYPKGKHAA
jgi:hypothetical protein